MKKNEMKKIALAGLLTGCLFSSHVQAAPTAEKAKSATEDSDLNAGNDGYHLMTEDELFLELTPEGIAQYKSLDKEGKKLALQVASARCNGTNACAGLNACQTDKNDCAGKGSCKGKGKCAFSDKNLAVKAVVDKLKMAGKRSSTLK